VIKRLTVVGVVLFVVVGLPSIAWAVWLASGSGSANAQADQVPDGDQPTVSLSGHNVTVTWPAAQFDDGTDVASYTVARYDAVSGVPQTIGPGCTGTISALTCTETAVPAGDWVYAVTPIQQNWVGAEGPDSDDVTVNPPSFSFTSSTNITSLPIVLNGTLNDYITGETATFRLDNATSGTLLAGSISPSPVPGSGTSSVTVTIPSGVTNGTHQVYAVGSSGSVANASIALNVPDTTAPVVSAAVIAKTAGGTPSMIKKSGTYYIYANANDPGVPSSGVGQVRANVNNVTTGQTNVLLTAGTFTVGGVTYGYRSSSLTAQSSLSAGSKSFTAWAIDTVGNTGSSFGGSVTVDNTKPAASAVQTTNAGIAGKAETGDKVILTYNEAMEPVSIIAGWNGGSTTVTVRLVQNGTGDRVQIYNAANTTVLPLGTIRLNRTDYTTSTVSFTNSTMTMVGGVVTITLGTPSGSVTTAGGAAAMSWTPSSTATDQSGNTASTSSFIETGTNDVDF
jgi:hypothetical protein